MKIIVRVRELRKDHNLTQEELARHLNISRQSLISLEQGRWLPSLPLVMQLAEFFRTPLEQVISTLPNDNHSPISNNANKEANMPRDLTPWSPFRELREMRDEIDRIFDQSIRVPSTNLAAVPAVNIKQDEKNVFIEAYVAGYKEDELDIDVSDDSVTISGTTGDQRKEEDKDKGFLHREFRYESFSRTLPLPPVVSDKADAKLRGGVLTITIPKVEEEKPKMKRLKPKAE